MNIKTTLILFVVCAAVFVPLYFFIGEEDGKSPESAKVEKALFDPKPETADIDRVELALRDGSSYTFARAGEEWRMTAPVDAPANRWEVESVIGAVTGIESVQEYAAGAADRPKDELAGLDRPIAKVKLIDGDKTVADLIVGARVPTGAGTYFKKADGDTLLVSKAELGRSFDKDLDQFRDKRVLNFNVKDVQRVRFEGLRHYEIVRGESDQWVLESPVRARTERDKVENAVRSLSTLRAQEYTDDNPPTYKIYGLDDPRLKVTVDIKREVPAKAKPGDPNTQPADTQPSMEERSFVVLVGRATDTKAENFFARLDSAPWVFTLSKSTIDAIGPELNTLRQSALAKVDVEQVTQVEVTTPAGQMVLTRDDDRNWTFADGRAADRPLVDDLLRAVRDLKAEEFVNPEESLVVLNWDAPRATVQLTQKGDLAPAVVQVGPPTESGRMVFVRNPAEDGVAAVREDAVAQLLQPPVSYLQRSVLRFDESKAREIQVVRQGHTPVRIAKSGMNWVMEEPVRAGTDADAVRILLQALSNLPAKRVAGVGNKAEFGLDNPEVQVTLTLEGEPAPADGQGGGAGVDTQPAEAAAPAATQPALGPLPPRGDPQREVVVLQQLLEYQKSNPNENPLATQMLKDMLAQRTGTATQPGDAATQPASTAPAVDFSDLPPEGDPRREQAVIEKLIEFQKSNPNENPAATQMLKDLLAKQQGQTTAPADTAAPAEPAAPTTQTEAPPPPPRVVQLLVSRKAGVTYACLAEDETIYELEPKLYDDVTAELHERQILPRINAGDVREITFEHASNGVKISLRKSGDNWNYLEDPLLPVDGKKVTDIVNGLRELRTERFADYAAADLAKYGLDAPAHRVALLLVDGRRYELLCSAAGPDGDANNSKFAARAGENKVFLLKADQADKFAQQVEDIEKKAGGGDAGGAEAAPVGAGASSF